MCVCEEMIIKIVESVKIKLNTNNVFVVSDGTSSDMYHMTQTKYFICGFSTFCY